MAVDDPIVQLDAVDLPARPHSLERVYARIGQFFKQTTQVGPSPIAQVVQDEITVGIMEVAENIIIHAYPPERRGTFCLILRLFPTHLEIDFSDRGLPFLGTLPPSPPRIALPDSSPPGGWGLFLVHRAMDEVRYARTLDGVNRWTLSKVMGR